MTIRLALALVLLLAAASPTVLADGGGECCKICIGPEGVYFVYYWEPCDPPCEEGHGCDPQKVE